MVSMSMLVVSARAGARGRSLVAGFIVVVCHEREMLGRQDRLEDLSCQNMYTIPIGVPNDGFLKLVSVLCTMQVHGDHYVDVDVAGSTGQPEPAWRWPGVVVAHGATPLSSMLSVPRHPISPFYRSSMKTLGTLTIAEPLMGTVVFCSILSP